MLQSSHHTEMHRYPELFERLSERLGPHARVLSFGCSTGEEIRTLQEVAPGWRVDGVELDDARRATAAASGPGQYFARAEEAPAETYDAVLALSVLCRYPYLDDGYLSFEAVRQACEALDARLLPGGLLVAFNAQYDVREALPRYVGVDLGLCRGAEGFAPDAMIVGDPGSGFVPKLTPEGRPLEAPVPLAFVKWKREAKPAKQASPCA